MTEIELSVMRRSQQETDLLRNLLNEFEQKTGARVNLQTLDWDAGRSEFIKISLYRHGPDVSEIGSTWVSDLIAMNSLRPFQGPDLLSIGTAADFIPQSWQSCFLNQDERMWAVPWFAETMLVHYRRDILEKAGIDPIKAFGSSAALKDTVQKLISGGCSMALATPSSRDKYLLVQTIASWIWENGGEFCTPDGRKVLLDQPPAIHGCLEFFNTMRLHPTETLRIIQQQGMAAPFHHGEAAMSIGGLWMKFYDEEIDPNVPPNWQAAPLLNHSFIGGSNLVIWQHTRSSQAALDLVRFLSSAAVIRRITQINGTLPAKKASLAALEHTDLVYQSSIQSMEHNVHAYPRTGLWGLIEEKVANLFAQTWNEMVENPSVDLAPIFIRRVETLAKQLNITLSSR